MYPKKIDKITKKSFLNRSSRVMYDSDKRSFVKNHSLLQQNSQMSTSCPRGRPRKKARNTTGLNKDALNLIPLTTLDDTSMQHSLLATHSGLDEEMEAYNSEGHLPNESGEEFSDIGESDGGESDEDYADSEWEGLGDEDLADRLFQMGSKADSLDLDWVPYKQRSRKKEESEKIGMG